MYKRDWSPEELKLKEALDKLYETDTRKPSKPLDLSFMNESPNPTKKHNILLRVAAIIAIILISSFTTAIFISNDYASAIKDSVEKKFFEMKHGVVVATDDEYTEEGETVWEIDDIELVEKTKEIIPEMPIPSYMPDGYEFDLLILHQYDNGDFLAIYNYKKADQVITINCQSANEEYLSSIYSNNDILELEDRIIIMSEDPISSTKSADISSDNVFIHISSSDSSISSEDLIKISKSIRF